MNLDWIPLVEEDATKQTSVKNAVGGIERMKGLW